MGVFWRGGGVLEIPVFFLFCFLRWGGGER